MGYLANSAEGAASRDPLPPAVSAAVTGVGTAVWSAAVDIGRSGTVGRLAEMLAAAAVTGGGTAV